MNNSTAKRQDFWNRINIFFPRHPIAQRDAFRVRPLPLLIRRIGEARSIMGYAAFLHLMFFVAGMLTYSRSTQAPFATLLSPFLTPLGLPLAVGFLHTILYWAALIGACNLVSALISRDRANGAWELLRLTPQTTGQILLAKYAAARSVWGGSLLVLMVTRLVASVAVPVAISMELHRASIADPLLVVLFILQPLADFMLACAVSGLAALLIRDRMLVRIGSYALLALTYGALNVATAIWLSFAQFGPAAGLLAPLNHWSLLVMVLTPVRNVVTYPHHALLLAITQIAIPVLMAWGAYKLTIRIAQRG